MYGVTGALAGKISQVKFDYRTSAIGIDTLQEITWAQNFQNVIGDSDILASPITDPNWEARQWLGSRGGFHSTSKKDIASDDKERDHN
jgi:hypothetical protein